MVLQPVGERHYFPVSPHPGRPAVKRMQYLICAFVISIIAFYETVNPVAIGPVAFHSNKIESFLFNQLFGNVCSPGIILMRTMTGFAEHHNPCITYPVEQWL